MPKAPTLDPVDHSNPTEAEFKEARDLVVDFSGWVRRLAQSPSPAPKDIAESLVSEAEQLLRRANACIERRNPLLRELRKVKGET
jgi:hypothetical protein